MRHLTRRAALVAVLVSASVVFALLVLEIAVRTAMPQQVAWDVSAVWEPVEGLGRRNRPGLDIVIDVGEGDVRFRTNDHGHRIGRLPGPAARTRILAVGDSFVQALQVEYEQTMTALLADALSGALGHPVEVVNMSVGGWDPNQYLIAARDELNRARYDLLLVFLFMQNDVVHKRVERYPPETGLAPPRLRLPPQAPWSETVPSLRAVMHGFFRRHSHLYVYCDNYLLFLRARAAGRTLDYLWSITRANAGSPRWAVTGAILRDIAEAANRFGAPTLFVLLPAHHYVDGEALADAVPAFGMSLSDVDLEQPAHLLAAELAPSRLPVVDITPAFRASAAAGSRGLFGRVDKHFGPEGHRVAAAFLARVVERLLRASPTEPRAESTTR